MYFSVSGQFLLSSLLTLPWSQKLGVGGGGGGGRESDFHKQWFTAESVLILVGRCQLHHIRCLTDLGLQLLIFRDE